jgi:hypothetical protein
LLWPWTPDDIRVMLGQFERGERVLCPVDGCPVRITVGEARAVRLKCLRCGGHARRAGIST